MALLRFLVLLSSAVLIRSNAISSFTYQPFFQPLYGYSSASYFYGVHATQLVVHGGSNRRLSVSQSCLSAADAIAEHPRLTTLRSLLPHIPELQHALGHELTLLAPNDAAWSKFLRAMPADAREELMSNATLLSIIVSYNMVWNATAGLRDGALLPTGIRGLSLRVTEEQGHIRLQGAGSRARVLESIPSTCGALLVTSAVLLPARLELLDATEDARE